jgi:hypothetical protein
VVYTRRIGLQRRLEADDSLQSFIFTLKNPQNTEPMKFGLRPERKDDAILCGSLCGPIFSGGFSVSDNCNVLTDSYTGGFGVTYANDAVMTKTTFFTGSEKCKVQEIEVFELVD